MNPLLLAGLGGMLGAMLRFQTGLWMARHAAHWKFPAATFWVNASGCLLMGVLAGLAERRSWFSPETRVFLMTGILGGYTTFSAFGLETVNLLRRGEAATAFGYVAGSVVCGLAAVWLGLKLTGGGAP